MRQGCFDGAFEPRPVTDRAIPRPGERRNVTITVTRSPYDCRRPEGCLDTAAAAVTDATLAPLPTCLFSPWAARAIRTRASPRHTTLYIAPRPLISHPGQLSMIGQLATPVQRPTCMEIRTDSLRSACLRT